MWFRAAVGLTAAGLSTLSCGGATESSEQPATVASVVISPRIDSVFETGQVQLSVVVSDKSGHPISNPQVSWWTLDTLHARISSTGVVSGWYLGRGSAVVHAHAGNITDSAIVVVLARPVASVSIQAPDSMLAADSQRAAVVLRDSVGSTLDARPLTFTSTDTTVLTVDSLGDLYPLVAGTTTLQVTSEGVTASVPLTIRELQFDSLWADGPTCAREVTGYLWCWGSNYGGVLGLPQGTVPSHAAPVRMGTVQFRRAEVGDGHGCGVTLAGAIVCWGDNGFGQVGIGTPGPSVPAPRLVPGSGALVNVTVGARHSCGWTAAGAAYCWGSNNAGQLGVGDTLDRASPTPVATAIQFSQLSAGDEHTCGLEAGTAALYCWGELFRSGYSRDSTVACVLLARCLQPLRVTGVPPFTVISSKGAGTCGLDGSVGVWCLPSHWDSIVHLAVDRTFNSLDASEGIFCGVATDHLGYCYSVFGTGPLGRFPVDLDLGTTSIPIYGGHLFTRVAMGRSGQACGQALRQVWCWGDNSAFQLGNRQPYLSDTAIIIIGHAH